MKNIIVLWSMLLFLLISTVSIAAPREDHSRDTFEDGLIYSKQETVANYNFKDSGEVIYGADEDLEIFNMISDVATPLREKMVDTDIDNVTSEAVYMELSSSFMSYVVRQMTNQTLDLVVMYNTNSSDIMSMEVGVMPSTMFGFRMKVLDDGDNLSLSGRIDVKPDEDSSFYLGVHGHESKPKTEMGLELKF